MSTERFAAVILACALAGTARAQSQAPPSAKSAGGEDPCELHRMIELRVPFYKAPSEVEGYNKIRLTMMPIVDATHGTLTIDVRGVAYYPDDVILIVGVRHAKLGAREYFGKNVHVVVKDRAFSCRFGPFKKVIPGGGLAVDACFLLEKQPEPVKKILMKERYFHCDPPCQHDQQSVGHIVWTNGGAEAQAEAEKTEKDEINAAREALLQAQRVCQDEIDKVNDKKADVSIAAPALAKLDQDIRAITDSFNSWRTTREFLLFSGEVARLSSLKSHIRQCERAAAADAGATIEDLDTTKVKDLLSKEQKEVKRVADELKGFIADSDSLDREWARLGSDLLDRYQKREDEADKCDPKSQPPKK